MRTGRAGQPMNTHERAAFVSAVQEAAGQVAGSLFDAVDCFPPLTEFGAVVVRLLGRFTDIARSAGSPVASLIEEAYEDAANRLDSLRAWTSSVRD